MDARVIYCIYPLNIFNLEAINRIQMTGNIIKDIGQHDIGAVKANTQVNIEYESQFGWRKFGNWLLKFFGIFL